MDIKRWRRFWPVLVSVAALALVLYVAAMSPLVWGTRNWAAARRSQRFDEARDLARRLVAQRPAAARPSELGYPRQQPSKQPPRPLVHASTADYPGQLTVTLAFRSLPVRGFFAEHFKVADAKVLRPRMARDMEQQARQQGLDGARLAQVLDFVFRDERNRRTAVLPVYAEHARYRGEPVWIVVLAWERQPPAAGKADVREQRLSLAHYRFYVVSERKNRIRLFQTCS
jgi:hypothetical protein